MAHHDIALSCVSFLNMRSKFIPGLYPNLTNHDLEQSVATGYNGLDQYACRYWISHVYDHVKEADSLDMTSCPELMEALLNLASFQRNSQKTTLGSGVESQDSEEPSTEPHSQNEALALVGNREVRNFLKCTLEFRQKLKDMESVLDSPDCEASSIFLRMHEIDTCTVRSKWQHENDPTWLSEVEVQVSEVIQKLLLLTDITIPAHMGVDQIRRYKALYSSIGLHCRYSSCTHQCVTYRSETERRKHEFAHVRSYKCTECDFTERPFASTQNLRKHQEKYHMTSVDFAIPLQIRSLAAKSLPPLRRKTQRLGARESSVHLSPIDQTTPKDLRTTVSNTRTDVHQNTQTAREYVAMSKALDLTDTSERDEFGSADLASTSYTESVVAHKLGSVGGLKAVTLPKICSISEASSPTGEPIQTATKTSHENLLTIDHIGKSHQESNTCNKNPAEDIDVVYVENSTKSALRFADGVLERISVESCVTDCVRFAVNFHSLNHGLHNAISMDDETRRISSCTPSGAQRELDAYYSCSRACWYNSIGPYIAATFANESAIPGISKEDTERRLKVLIRKISKMGRDISHRFLKPPTRFLPQEMIRFESSINFDDDFWQTFNMWGPKHLKERHQGSMSQMNAYIDVDEFEIALWLKLFIRKDMDDGSYVHRSLKGKYFQDLIRDERIDAHSKLWPAIVYLVHPNHHPIHRPVGIDGEGFTHYVLSLLCKARSPTEMVKRLKVYLKPSK